MAYREIGVYQRPLGEFLLDGIYSDAATGTRLGIIGTILDAGNIKDKPGSSMLPGILKAALIGGANIHPRRFLSEVTDDEILTLVGGNQYSFGKFMLGSSELAALQWLIIFILANAGFSQMRVPHVLGYQETPELSIDQVLAKMISADILDVLPTKDELSVRTAGGSRSSMQWSAFVAMIPEIIHEIKKVALQREFYLTQLRAKACDLGFQITLGKRLTQEEKSFFLLFASGGTRSLTAEERETKTVPCLRATRNDSLEIREAWTRYQSVALSGPASRFFKLITNKNGRDISFYWGPAPMALPVFTAHQRYRGPFLESIYFHAGEIPWTEESQKKGMSERDARVLGRKGADIFALIPPMQTVTAATQNAGSSADEEEFMLSYNVTDSSNAAPVLSTFEIAYHSMTANRLLSTVSGTFPGCPMILYDKAFNDIPFGGGMNGVPTLDGYDYIFPQHCALSFGYGTGDSAGDAEQTEGNVAHAVASQGSLQAGSEYGPGLDVSPSYVENIYYPGIENGSVYLTQVDFRAFYYRMGSNRLRPGFRGYVLAPRSWLFTPQPDAINFVTMRLGFSPEELFVMKDSIEVSHNHAALSRMLHASGMPRLHPAVYARTHA